jgi:tetratricopeptide (TPR) repeat protein
MKNIILSMLLFGLIISCSSPETDKIPEINFETQTTPYEALSLLGVELYPPDLPPTVQKSRENALEESIIWYGRRLAYLSRYRDAIKVFTEGIKEFPDSYKLYRHRGHRYLSIRKFDEAIADFSRARSLMPAEGLEIEPDGMPNSINQPLSNTQFNILYHLALGHYLKGNFREAAKVYEDCLNYCDNNDLLIATIDWLYMTYRRLGDDDKAEAILERISPGMVVVENGSYFNRLLMYKGLKAPEDLLNLENSNDPEMAITLATQGYGVGNWYLINGDVEKAGQIFKRVLESNNWAAFGYIAAEADMSRLDF